MSPICVDRTNYGKENKGRWYEVVVYQTERGYEEGTETPEVVAKFKAPGDARAFATDLAKRPVWYAAVVAR